MQYVPTIGYSLAGSHPNVTNRPPFQSKHDIRQQTRRIGAHHGRIKKVDREKISGAADFERTAGRAETARAGHGRGMK